MIEDRQRMRLILLVLLFREICSSEYLSDSGKHLFYFVHVTDIHVSQFQSVDRIKQLEMFCNEIVKDLIQPAVTVVTGDLTHNRDPHFSSSQYQVEWKTYRDVLDRTEITKSTKWLDIRGNHDSFMDADPDSNNSFYRIYSEQGRQHRSSYRYQLTSKDGDVYSFIGIDFTPRPGPGRPFNFLGQLDEKEMNKIEELLRSSENSTSIITFGHYPLSFTNSGRLKESMKKVLVYLNGHLHLLFGRLYFRHFDGLIELELGDWKDNRRFRLVAIDSGLLSFGDFRFDESIFAVITNPKSVDFQSNREDLKRIEQSSHIRILVFSKKKIVSIRVSIDSIFLGEARRSNDSVNLFLLQWKPSVYRDKKIHRILVEISDEQGQEKKIDQDFTVEEHVGHPWTRILSNSLILLIDWPRLGFVIISSSLLIYMGSLIFFRCRAKRANNRVRICFSLCNKIRHRMFVLCSIDSMFFSLLALSLYHFIGPWYVGYLTEARFGLVFLWGSLIGDRWIPWDMQLYFGTIQLWFFLIPLTLCLSSSSFYRFSELQTSSDIKESRFDRLVRLVSVQILLIYSLIFLFQWSFGATASYKFAWILSPFGLPLIVFSLILYWKTRRLTIDEFLCEDLSSRKQRDSSMSSNEKSLGKEN